MFKSRIPQITAQMRPRLLAALEAGGELIAKDAAMRAPDAPPYGEGLVDAIHTEVAPEGVYVVAGDEDVYYGHLVEFGTVHSSSQPFLIPAVEAKRDEVLGLVRAALKGL